MAAAHLMRPRRRRWSWPARACAWPSMATGRRGRVVAAEVGVARARSEELAGGDAAANAKSSRGGLRGPSGRPRDCVCINAAAALVAGGRAAEFRRGARLAAKAIDSGLALAKLQALIEFSRA